jgi:hypothetical protein
LCFGTVLSALGYLGKKIGSFLEVGPGNQASGFFDDIAVLFFRSAAVD